MSALNKTARFALVTRLVCSAFSRRHSRSFGKPAPFQKCIALLILALFGGFYAVPLLQAASTDPEAGLPACCRRNGNHHCASMGLSLKSIASDAPQFRAAPQHCPFYPQASTAPVVRFHASLVSSAAFFAQVVSHPAVQPQVR